MKRRGAWISAGVAVVVVAAGLVGIEVHHSKESGADSAARRAAQAFVSDWQGGRLAAVAWNGTTGAAMQTEYAAAVAGMGAIKPAVKLSSVQRNGTTATAHVAVTWPLGSGQSYSYTSAVTLTDRSGGSGGSSGFGSWRVSPEGVAGASDFAPITRDARLSLSRTQAARGLVTGKGGATIVGPGKVVDVGIEPSRMTNAASLVKTVARLTGVEAAPLAKAVAAALPDAFVPVITLREADYLKVADRLQPLKGTVFRSRMQSLGLTRDFARALLGTVGPVTAEIVQASGNRYSAGDFAGVSGLERIYDARLGGGSSYTVSEVPKDPKSDTSIVTLFHNAATPGQPLATTLDPKVQDAADAALSRLKVPGALVALDVKTGAVLAVADTPSNGLNRAMVGQYPPGSTLKVATTLALLQGGLKTSTHVECPPTATVGGRSFRNYEHESGGSVPFSVDFAKSCNTAFVGLSKRLRSNDLHAAAAELGVGDSWGAGLGAGPQTFTGSIPTNTSAVDQAAAAFGQGRDLVSPLSMAVMAATVARGSFLAPALVTSPAPTPAPIATPSTTPSARDIATLHTLMREVVTGGTAAGQFTGVPGGPIFAKTGTAEFGSASPPQTHAWLVGWQGNLAFAAFVDTGRSGAVAAGPVVRSFLTAVHRG
jgi:cell division protein FtsI/penicillin-binding protein 2